MSMKVRDFAEDFLTGSGFAFGITRTIMFATITATDPTTRKGSWKPPTLYRTDPTAGPGTRKILDNCFLL